MKIETKEAISVTLQFFASFREYGPAKVVLTIPKNSKVRMLMDKYNIPKDTRKTIIIVNGKPHQSPETILNDGDIISIFPPIGGG